MFYHPATQRKIPSGSAFELDGMQYPQNWLNLTTAAEKQAHGIYDLITDPQPAFNPLTQLCVAGEITAHDNAYHETWTLLDLPAETIANNIAAATEKFQADVVVAVQVRLDEFAKTRNYDGILSACTYATSAVTKFAAEGQYAVNVRDTDWATLYSLMADVQAGTKTMPATVDEVIALFPELTWPA